MALKFKKYTWPNDPHTYREVLRRQPQYTTSGGTTSYSGMGATGRGRDMGVGVAVGSRAERRGVAI